MENIGISPEMPLAYALFRALLGINICLHGVTRLADGGLSFTNKISPQFAHTILPLGLVWVFALVLPWADAIIGFLVTLGLGTFVALTAGFLLMLLMTFGTCLVHDWPTAGLQLIYGFAYAALLFLQRYNRYSLDFAMRKARKS